MPHERGVRATVVPEGSHSSRAFSRGSLLLHGTAGMCGIVGIAYRDPSRPVSATLIRQLCGIRHRGPDDEGVYLQGSVGLGIRRLSIIDLQAGASRSSAKIARKVIVFNGEIYNYRELRRGLVARVTRSHPQ